MRYALAAGLALSVAAPASAQLTQVERELGETMLGNVFWIVDSLYYDSAYGEPEWAEHWWPAREKVRQAGNWAEILGAIANALYGMQDSHTRFIPPGLTIAADYGWRWRVVGDSCYVSAVSNDGDARRQGLRPGDRVVSIDGLTPTRANLDVITYVYHELNPRSRMRVVVARPDGAIDTVAFEAKVRRRPPLTDLSDLETRRRLLYEASREPGLRHRWKEQDSVAVWAFNMFDLDDRRIDRHMEQARRRPWLILDLRGNTGGVLETADRLLGHFADSAYEAFTQIWRDSTTTSTVAPRGDGPFRGKVIVLVDSETGSSAELVTWTLRARHGAVVLGDRTAGKVRGSLVIPLEAGGGHGRWYGFGVQVSVFDIVLPDGTRLEGVGLVPDETVLPGAPDIAAGRDVVLQRALAMAGVVMSAEEAAKLLR